jgi:hypothetical protein
MSYNNNYGEVETGIDADTDRFARSQIRQSRSYNVQDYAKTLAEQQERAANNQSYRTRNDLIASNDIQRSNNDRDLSNKIQLMKAENEIKNSKIAKLGETIDSSQYMQSNESANRDLKRVTDKESRMFEAMESQKNRDFDTFNKANDRLTDATQRQADRQTQEQLARISQQTALAGQAIDRERAIIAAKAQISSSIFNNQTNYGGYW